MERLKNESVLASTNVTGEISSSAFDLDGASSFCCVAPITVGAPAAKTFLGGESEINTLTFEAQADMVDGEYVVVTDTNGDNWAIAADLTGSSAAPTGAIWTAIAAGKKAQVDLSGATTAITVAAAFEVAFDGLTGFTALCVTDDSAADGTMLFTHVARGPVANAQSLLEDDSGAGGVTVAETNAGVASTVDVTANTIAISTHGYITGVKGQLTTTGTLPDPLATSTDYFVIVVNANSIKLATTLAYALAGTAVNITNQGADGNTHTFTPTALAGAAAMLKGSVDGTNYATVTSSSQSITASGNLFWNEVSPAYRYVKFVVTLTAGQLVASASMQSVGDGN